MGQVTGRGSITNRSSRGRGWEARWYTIEADGKRHQHSETFDRKKKAEKHLNKVLGVATWGNPNSNGQTSFADVAQSWLATLDVKPKTRAGYENILKVHLSPEFGDRAVGGITVSDVREFLASLNGRSPGTKRNIIRVLNPIMKQALQEGEIATNPVTGVKLPRTARNDDLPFLDDRQVQELADEVGPKYRALIVTAVYTGLRAGELAALRVKDLDLLHKRLRVRESVSDVNGVLHLVPPKNGRTRSLSLPGFLVDLLAEQQAGKKREEFVFGGAKPVRHGNFYIRHFRPAVTRLVESGRWTEDFAKLRFHDLRHTAASLLIKNGEHPKAVQERLGHSSITITMDRYGHLYEGHDTEIADHLEKAYLASLRSAR